MNYSIMNFSQRCGLLCLYLGNLIVGVSYMNSITFGNAQSNPSKSWLSRVNLNPPKLEDVILPVIPTKDEKRSHLGSGTLCPPYDSCTSRCGTFHKGFTYICNCDNDCSYYGDCCIDFQKTCLVDESRVLNDIKIAKKPKCELWLETFPIFMVSECSENWKNKSVQDLCHTSLPVKCVVPEIISQNNDCEAVYRGHCWERLAAVCNESIGPSCSELIEKKCKQLSSIACKNCNEKFWPAIGVSNDLYKNSFCAACNYENNYTVPTLINFLSEVQKLNYSDVLPIRRCFESAIDTCDSSSSLSSNCSKFSGPIMRARGNNNRKTIYKNIFCAQCHGEILQNYKCSSYRFIDSPRSFLNHGEIKTTVWDFITRDGLKVGDIPAAFSMLLNFGLDGRQRVYISSEGNEELQIHQRLCGKGYIWDPFSTMCRKLHCSTEFVLVDYECIKKEPTADDKKPPNNSTLIPDANAEFVHLTLSAEIELIDFLQFNGQDIDTIIETLQVSFSVSFNISLDRIRNVRFNISLGNFETKKQELTYLKEIDDVRHPVKITIDLDLYESSTTNKSDSEPSVDSIVSMLASAVSTEGFEFGMNNITGRIFDMQQTVDFLKGWCELEDGGQKRVYWNSEFKLILNDNITLSAGERIQGIYINKTGKTYPKGFFVADILYKGYQYNKNLINVSGLAIVCDWKIKLNESCARILLEKHEYSISANGSLLVLNESLTSVVDDSIFEEGENGSILVCFLKPYGPLVETYKIEMDISQAYVSYILSWISIFAMIIVLITYCLFSNLRNLPGCNTMNLTISLLVMQITYNFGQKSTVTGLSCKVVAIVLHYEILCCFMWMNVMAYDLFKTFGTKTVLNTIRSKSKYLPRYMLYAYGIPLLVIVLTTLLDFFLADSQFTPRYGEYNICWITNKYAAILYFAVPLATVMCVNFIFYVITITSIQNVKCTINFSDEKCKKSGKNDVFLYARMASVIGLTWALSFAAAYVREDKITGKILTYLFIIFNTLQGVFIFWVFVCNHRIYNLYRVSLLRMIGGISSAGKSCKPLNRFAKAMHRTVSTNTVISTISNSSESSTGSNLRAIKE